MAQELLNGKQVAKMLGLGLNQVRTAMRLGQLPCIDIASRRYVPRRALLKRLESLEPGEPLLPGGESITP